MGFMHVLSVLSYVLICINFTTGQQSPAFKCYDTGNFTTNSNYANNRKNILSSLATDVKSNNGFFTGNTGQGPDEVHALAICRGDLTLTECARCITSTSQDIMTECPNQKEALYMSSGCLVRYADRSFSGKMELYPVRIGCNASNLKSDMTQFGKIWGNLMDSLCKKASMSYSQFRFATGEADLTLFQTIYAVVQCTPDLSQIDCDSCLRQYVANYTSSCYGKQGGGFRGPSCMFRWELYPFYNAATPNNSTIVPGKSQISSSIIIAIVAPITVAAVLFLAGYCFLTRRARKKNYTAQGEFAGNDILTAEALQFDFETIQAATNRFMTDNKLGAGGFGEVYKGVLPNGQEIAVKRLSKRSGQGAEEFKNEVVVVARLRHRNLVRLQGFCMEGEEKILVYEFVPNKSLDYFLYDIEKRQQLDWPKRYNIIGGIARGILYLHEDSPLRIIHRDLKASNVLLDRDMNPKIADFGMARIVGIDQTQGNTSKIVGTYGYMAPEYAMQGQFSIKSDCWEPLELCLGTLER
ncbi:hypothetical protein QYF36_020016 [Acer negundo]|nr:hypothetical protein QYF36_020016 [Acer negundo]